MSFEKTALKKGVGKIIESTADENYNPFTETMSLKAKHAVKKLFVVHIVAVIMFAVNSSNPLIGFALGISIIGIYGLITGTAWLKPGLTKYSVFFGWKARIVGIVELVFAAFILSS